MTSRIRPSEWSVATRLMALALVPALLMLVVVNVSLYLVSFDEAQADVRERSRVMSSALAESSRYGVVSGNLGSVERAIRGLMDADRSLVVVEVLSDLRAPLVLIKRAEPGPYAFTDETAIAFGSLDVDLLDRGAHAPSPTGAAGSRVAGYIRVTLSPTPLLEAKRSRLIQGSLLVLMACGVATAVGLALARRLRRPLDQVIAALRQLRRASFGIRIDPIAGGELGELQQAILVMAEELGASHQKLEGEVARRTADLQQAMRSLETADAERRRLIARGNELVEDERRKLSLEIHDELNAVIVAVRLQAGGLSSEAAATGSAEVRRVADRIAGLADDLYRRARAIVEQLRPELLDTLGLSGAIEEMVRRMDEAHTDCRFGFRLEDRLPQLPEPIAIAAYRAVQEALSNVAKHAFAAFCEVTISVVQIAQDERIRIHVEDDGKGYDPTVSQGGGIGLIGMRERVAALKGTVAIASEPGRGTAVTIEIPLPASTG